MDDLPSQIGHQSMKTSSAGERSAAGRRSRRWTALLVAFGIGLAGFLLYRTVGQYSLDELVASVLAVPATRLLAAGGFAAASYLCLTGFDFLALRYVRHPLPYRRAAVASFASLSLGHNIGFAALSSGAIRYRFYTRWGLGPGEVAKVILFCGVTVGLGLVTLGGLALLGKPDLAGEMTGLGRAPVLGFGVLCLVVPAGYLALTATVTQTLCFRGWRFELPSWRLAAGQILIGTTNFACVAACLHQALGAGSAYLETVAVYVVANATSIVSHVPGGLGVIESVVIYLHPGSDLIGPLLVFRFVYFLVPLALGGALFLASEAVFRWRDRSRTSDATRPS